MGQLIFPLFFSTNACDFFVLKITPVGFSAYFKFLYSFEFYISFWKDTV